MANVTVREFSHNPSAMFARAQKGETIDVTKHGEVIATLIPPQRKPKSRHDELVEQGIVKPSKRGLTTAQLDQYTRIEVPDDVDPLAILLEMREHER